MRCLPFAILFIAIAAFVSLLVAGWIFISLEWVDGQPDGCYLAPGKPGEVLTICPGTPTPQEYCDDAKNDLFTFDNANVAYLTTAQANGWDFIIDRIEATRQPLRERVTALCHFTPTPSMTSIPTPTATFTASATPMNTATSSPTTTPTATPTTIALETPMNFYTPTMPPTMMPKPFPEYDSPTVIPTYPTPQPTWEPSPVDPVVAPTPTITPTPSPIAIPVVIDIQEKQPTIENDPNYWVILAGISAVLAQIAVILGVIYRIKHNKEP